MHRFPTLNGLKPSTSFSSLILLKALFWSICFGTGLWSKIPLTDLSSFNLSINSKSSDSEVVSGNKNSSNSTPTFSHAFDLFLT